MLNSVLRLSLAILAIAALSGCAIERLTGPQVDVSDANRGGAVEFVEREGDPQPPTGDDVFRGGIEAASDTLRTGDNR